MIRRVRISTDLINETLRHGNTFGTFIVSQGIPLDAKVIDVRWMGHEVELYFHSLAFEDDTDLAIEITQVIDERELEDGRPILQ